MNRKTFLQRLSIGLAALWATPLGKQTASAATASLEDVDSLSDFERCSKANAELRALADNLNKQQLWCSRFPSLVTSAWKPFNQPGVLGCKVDGSNGFLWIEFVGPSAEIERLRQLYVGKPELFLPQDTRSWPPNWYLRETGNVSYRLRTPLLEPLRGQDHLRTFVRGSTTYAAYDLPVAENWQHIYADTRRSYDNAVVRRQLAFYDLADIPPL